MTEPRKPFFKEKLTPRMYCFWVSLKRTENISVYSRRWRRCLLRCNLFKSSGREDRVWFLPSRTYNKTQLQFLNKQECHNLFIFLPTPDTVMSLSLHSTLTHSLDRIYSGRQCSGAEVVEECSTAKLKIVPMKKEKSFVGIPTLRRSKSRTRGREDPRRTP